MLIDHAISKASDRQAVNSQVLGKSTVTYESSIVRGAAATNPWVVQGSAVPWKDKWWKSFYVIPSHISKKGKRC